MEMKIPSGAGTTTHLYWILLWRTPGRWTFHQKRQWHMCMLWTITSHRELIISQDKYMVPEKYLFCSSWLVEPLRYNLRYCIGRCPSWCHQILIETPHWTCPPCGDMSWIHVGTFLQKMWLPIYKHSQFMSCLLCLSEKVWSDQSTECRIFIW